MHTRRVARTGRHVLYASATSPQWTRTSAHTLSRSTPSRPRSAVRVLRPRNRRSCCACVAARAMWRVQSTEALRECVQGRAVPAALSVTEAFAVAANSAASRRCPRASSGSQARRAVTYGDGRRPSCACDACCVRVRLFALAQTLVQEACALPRLQRVHAPRRVCPPASRRGILH